MTFYTTTKIFFEKKILCKIFNRKSSKCERVSIWERKRMGVSACGCIRMRISERESESERERERVTVRKSKIFLIIILQHEAESV